jgi:phycocyanobilin:ferredoxin oxidoreductase
LSVLWNHLIECQNKIIEIFEEHATEVVEEGLDSFNRPDSGWINRVWANDSVRRAHIDVVDARDTKGLWMMHVCVFPNLTNDAPIYGFDVIAGKNKMTGAFHDFSPSSGGPEHPMMFGYNESVRDFIPSKKRELPEWATNIFSENMLAAGNVSKEEEAIEIINIAVNNLYAWFDEVSIFNNTATEEATIKAQNYYCHNQQQNPHTPKVMKSLGLPEEDVDVFCRDMLFPSID